MVACNNRDKQDQKCHQVILKSFTHYCRQEICSIDWQLRKIILIKTFQNNHKLERLPRTVKTSVNRRLPIKKCEHRRKEDFCPFSLEEIFLRSNLEEIHYIYSTYHATFTWINFYSY